MNALTTVPTLWGHIHVVVEVGTNWLLMDALVKVYLYSSYSHYVIVMVNWIVLILFSEVLALIMITAYSGPRLTNGLCRCSSATVIYS